MKYILLLLLLMLLGKICIAQSKNNSKQLKPSNSLEKIAQIVAENDSLTFQGAVPDLVDNLLSTKKLIQVDWKEEHSEVIAWSETLVSQDVVASSCWKKLKDAQEDWYELDDYFVKISECLKPYGLSIGTIDNNSDQYYFFITQEEKKDKLAELAENSCDVKFY